MRHEAGFNLRGNSLLRWASLSAARGAYPRQAGADGSFSNTDWPAGSSRTMPGEAQEIKWGHNSILAEQTQIPPPPQTQFIGKTETIPSGTHVSGRNGLFEIHWQLQVLLRMHGAFSCRGLGVPSSQAPAECLVQMLILWDFYSLRWEGGGGVGCGGRLPFSSLLTPIFSHLFMSVGEGL